MGRGDEFRDELFPDEALWIRNAVATRREEYRAGRACARRALQAFGFSSMAIPTGTDRRPQWPAGIVGSISHALGCCGAVVARAEAITGLGFDVEMIGGIQPELYPAIFTPQETSWLARCRNQAEWATVLFSAKESLFKSFSGTEPVECTFHDVEITPRAASSCLDVTLRRVANARSAALMCRYAFVCPYVLTGATLLRECSPARLDCHMLSAV